MLMRSHSRAVAREACSGQSWVMGHIAIRYAGLLLGALFLSSCAGLSRASHDLNPIGWPSKVLTLVGTAAADSGVPLVRETGRWIGAAGELVDAPALLVEGIVTLSGDDLVGAGEHLVAGVGSTATATWNLPFFVMPGANIDIAQDVDLVNGALAAMEKLDPMLFRHSPDDPRTFVFPKGTRARASGKNLIYTIPGYGDVTQACEANLMWNALQEMAGTTFAAQERSWGFVVDSDTQWSKIEPRLRAKTILHELYHQHMQMREWLLGWSMIYWPAYITVYPFTGWRGHWAEMGGPHDAGIVNRALRTWILRPTRSTPSSVSPSRKP